MLNNTEYNLLARFGSGTWMKLNDIYGMLTYGPRGIKTSISEFKQLIFKFLSYGWLQRQEYKTMAFSHAARFCLTHKGSDALEYYKKFRYGGTAKKHIVTKEQNFKFKLQAEGWSNNV